MFDDVAGEPTQVDPVQARLARVPALVGRHRRPRQQAARRRPAPASGQRLPVAMLSFGVAAFPFGAVRALAPPSEKHLCRARGYPFVTATCVKSTSESGAASRRWRGVEAMISAQTASFPLRAIGSPRSRCPYPPRHQEPSFRFVDCPWRRGPRAPTRARSAPRRGRLQHRAPASRSGGCRASRDLCRNLTITALHTRATRRAPYAAAKPSRAAAASVVVKPPSLGRCCSCVLAGVRVGVCALEAFPRGLRGRGRDAGLDVH